jgi:hypothetical protein
LEQIALPEHHPERHYLGHGEATLAFFLALDAINFGSGYFPRLRKRPGMSGYFTIASSLTDHFRACGPFSAADLARLSTGDCTRIFAQDPENGPVQELMGLFCRALNDLGNTLLERYGGSYVALVESAGASAERLVQRLIEMPLYNDVAQYHGLRVPFFKRAQLTAADLAIAFSGRGPGRFHDLDRLTLFADNLVPHVLRVDRLLRYDQELAARIDREDLVPAGSDSEIEIRACALHVVEQLAEELQGTGHEVTPMQLDYILWNRGQRPEYKRARPRHRTRTVYY